MGLLIISSISYAKNNENIIGVPVIKDSGTLLINGKTLSLWGINTLAPDQQCWENGMSWCCGERATMVLKHFVGGKKIKCKIIEKNKVKCLRKKRFRKKDLSKFLVSKGLALDANGYYKKEEQKAKKQRIGIWSGKFQTAKDWKNGIQRFIKIKNPK